MPFGQQTVALGLLRLMKQAVLPAGHGAQVPSAQKRLSAVPGHWASVQHSVPWTQVPLQSRAKGAGQAQRPLARQTRLPEQSASVQQRSFLRHCPRHGLVPLGQRQVLSPVEQIRPPVQSAVVQQPPFGMQVSAHGFSPVGQVQKPPEHAPVQQSQVPAQGAPGGRQQTSKPSGAQGLKPGRALGAQIVRPPSCRHWTAVSQSSPRFRPWQRLPMHSRPSQHSQSEPQVPPAGWQQVRSETQVVPLPNRHWLPAPQHWLVEEQSEPLPRQLAATQAPFWQIWPVGHSESAQQALQRPPQKI